MDPENPKWSSTGKWWLLLGGLVAFVVVFNMLEVLLATGPTPSEDGSGSEDRGGEPSPALPEVRRLEGGAVEIRHDLFRRTTIRLGNEAEAAALADCLEAGIERAFGAGTHGRTNLSIRLETRRIQNGCLGSIPDLPVPPPLPDPPR